MNTLVFICLPYLQTDSKAVCDTQVEINTSLSKDFAGFHSPPMQGLFGIQNIIFNEDLKASCNPQIWRSDAGTTDTVLIVVD